MKTYAKVLFGSTIGLIGLTIAFKTLNKSQLTLMAIGALPTGVIAHFIADERLAKKEEYANNRYNFLIKRFGEVEKLQKNTEANLNKAVSEVSQLTVEKQKLNNLIIEVSKNAQQSEDTINFLAETNSKNEIAIKEARHYIAELEAEIREWENTFNEKLDIKAQQIALSQFNKVCTENDQITLKAMDCSRRFYQIILKAQTRLDSMKTAANSFIEETNNKAENTKVFIEQEITEYLKQIELLNEKVARLQQECNGDLIEPVYYQASYDINAQIGNSIAKEFYQLTQIALSVNGFLASQNGSISIGYGYSQNVNPTAIVETLKQYSSQIAKSLGLYKITVIKKLEITDCIELVFRREPALKDDEIKNLVGTADEFLQYVINHPIRYRLIANPGQGKSPTLAVMISEILKAGCKRGNKARGSTVENTLVTVSYPDVESSLKDSNYPLDIFVKYGNTTQANKSFDDAIKDWEFRKQYPSYAEKFFKIWVWEELDNTLDSASDVDDSSKKIKKIAKQGGHNNIGFIVSGQSVLTKQIKAGFSNDDRSLFTEIIIGIPKIRKYVTSYGKLTANLQRLAANLDEIEEYINAKNAKITDEARELRIALVMDERSPKLYLLPNLDRVNFDINAIENTRIRAEQYRESLTGLSHLTQTSQKALNNSNVSESSEVTLEGMTTSDINATCPHCSSSNLRTMGKNRYCCKNCGKSTVKSKILFK